MMHRSSRYFNAKVFGAAALAGMVAMSTLAEAGSANGTWLRDNGAHVLAFDCGGGLGLKVTKSPEANKVGKTIMCGAKPSGPNKWKGTVLNLDDGQKYSGSVTVSGNSLTLSGCVLGGLVCKNDTWSRLK
ncbi:MAG: DUF2147 domain-containing protein [Hyphomicrobium sp.]|nr:DUF2147 domain-containing protein [Hyphomicrobium sp.]